jgi:hypothetical protein
MFPIHQFNKETGKYTVSKEYHVVRAKRSEGAPLFHVVHTHTAHYVVSHENKSNAYLSTRATNYTIDSESCLCSEHHTYLWINQYGELWQHRERARDREGTNMFRCFVADTSRIEDQVRVLSARYGFDVDEAIDLLAMGTANGPPNVCENVPLRMMQTVIQNQDDREHEENDPWKGSVFERIQTLKCNNVGNVGEYLVKDFCDTFGLSYVYEGTRNRNNANGTFDILIENKRVECKTARVGKHGTFQHETIRKDGSDCHIFLDICPDSYYVTILPKMSFDSIQELTGRKPHPRKGTTDVFKLDFGESTLHKLVKEGYAIHVRSTTATKEVCDFFHSHFKNR